MKKLATLLLIPCLCHAVTANIKVRFPTGEEKSYSLHAGDTVELNSKYTVCFINVLKSSDVPIAELFCAPKGVKDRMRGYAIRSTCLAGAENVEQLFLSDMALDSKSKRPNVYAIRLQCED